MAATARLLLFLVASFLASSSSFSRVAISTTSSPASPRNVSLALYYETLCPYCSNFIVNHLSKIFHDGLISIVDLDLIPYGNARLGSNSTMSCQHGPNECLLNTVEACAINAWPDLLELQYAEQTDSLQPPHRYVPWVVVDGQPLYEDYEKFEAYICKAYHGEPPETCLGLLPKKDHKMKADNHVSYADEMISSSIAAVHGDAKIDMVV
ncbi:gamma-interferon-responsive lysosomal thiol protein-like isoform X2 [Musa acuminata AAA Group]|uniref:gamma-interferon-responsive lysosomal thiol protein-like isoform X2 n=1 Tax=Musa acuminata AAA Group TaxID=214697 RepID=UPI0031DEB9E6